MVADEGNPTYETDLDQGLVLAGKRPTPGDRSDRASRAAGVQILYSTRPGRIWPAAIEADAESRAKSTAILRRY